MSIRKIKDCEMPLKDTWNRKVAILLCANKHVGPAFTGTIEINMSAGGITKVSVNKKLDIR